MYAPNSYGGPEADPQYEDPSWFVRGEILRSAYDLHAEDDDFVQPRALWTNVLSETAREHLVTNIVTHLENGVSPEVLARAVDYWSSVHPELGSRIARGVGLPTAAGSASRRRNLATRFAGEHLRGT